MQQRELTVAQHSKLDRLDREDPAACVIGWRPARHGPVIRRGDGRLQAIGPLGRLYPTDLADVTP